MTIEQKGDRIIGRNLEEIIVDLTNALSAIKVLSELNCHASSEQELLKKALEALIQHQDMERCSFFVLQDDGVLTNVAGLSCLESIEENRQPFKPLEFKLGEGIIGLAAETKTLQHSQNCREDARFFSGRQQAVSNLPGSVICVPVFSADVDLVGVLNISHPEPYYFSDWHVRLLDIYKNMLGQMISNYRLFHEMERQIAVRTAKLEDAYEDIKRLKEYYENISVLDQLTGLYNRRYFYNQIEHSIAAYERYGHEMCLLLLDIDHFKSLNDTYGHAFGDQVLVDVATALKCQTRQADVLVRFGGEEFVIIFTNTGCDNGITFAERIRTAISELQWQRDGDSLMLTISIGVYCCDPKCSASFEAADVGIDKIVHYADLALYEAKKRGRNRVVMFSPEMLKH